MDFSYFVHEMVIEKSQNVFPCMVEAHCLGEASFHGSIKEVVQEKGGIYCEQAEV